MIYVKQNSSSVQNKTENPFNYLIKFGNCLGILPVTTGPKFSWKSWKCVYTCVLISVYIIDTVFCIRDWTLNKFTFRLLARQLHQINAFTALILYLKLAKKWAKFSKLWSEVDKIMNSVYGNLKHFDKRILITTVIILAASLGECALLINYQIMKTVNVYGTYTTEYYYKRSFSEFFTVVPYHWFTASVASISMLIGYIIWSYNDLFIILISSAVALRFKQITDRLSLNEKKANSNEYWIELRADYDRLVHLSKKLDKYISYIVLLSYSANIFFLLMQLSNVIGHLNTRVQICYYTYSFSFLIARLVAVSLYGAWISDESKEPANSLNSVPSATYNLEIRRLLLQISFNDVAITGSKMFKVTRGLLLNVAGAIVTYELVMFQFSKSMEGLT